MKQSASKRMKASEKEIEGKDEKGLGAEAKGKRKRRTKAELEAEKAAKALDKSKPTVAQEA